MKTITLELSEAEFARLAEAAHSRREALTEFLKARLIEVPEKSADPFDPRGGRQRARHEEFLRRIA